MNTAECDGGDLGEEGAHDQGQVDEEAGARRPRTRRAPDEPTDEERREHEITHTPFRSWCRQCAQARGKANPHKKMDDEDKALGTFHLDYWFMRDKPGAPLVPVANLYEESTRSYRAHVVCTKGSHEFVVRQLCRDIESLGFSGDIILKCDQEAALVDLANGVRKMRGEEGRTIIETAKTKDSQSHGRAERAVQSVEGIVRTMKLALGRRLGSDISCDHPVMTWLVEHGAETLNRFQVSNDGKTSCERSKGKKYKGDFVEFGRRVMHRQPGKVRGGVMSSRWSEGVWIGKRNIISDEHLIATAGGGVVKTSSINLKTDTESWDGAMVKEIKGTPWNPSGNDKDLKEEDVVIWGPAADAAVEMRPREDVEPPPQGEVERIPRDLHIKREHLVKHGFTKGCSKCDDIRAGRELNNKKAHTPECPARMKKILI